MSTRESSYADSGADVGIECAMYNDIKNHIFPDPNGLGSLTPPAEINCVGTTYSVSPSFSGSEYQFTFKIDSNDLSTNAGYGVVSSNSAKNRPGCVQVFVDKKYGEVPGSNPPKYLTHIVSRGYNVTCDQVTTLSNGSINPHIVERRSEVKYNSAGGPIIGGGNSSVNISSSATNISPFSPYTITWSSLNVDSGSCQETVSPDDGDTWPQNSENGSNQISGNPGDGTYTYTIDCISSVDHVTHKIASVAVKISSGGGGFNTPSLDIRARPKIGVPTSGSITLPAGQTDAEISWYPAFVTNCQRDVPPYATANAIWLSGPTNSIGNFFGQVFPSGYPVGDFTDRTFGIKCTADNTTGPLAGTILRAQVTVRYQPVVNNNPPLADIYADPAVGANVGQNASGGLLSLTQADLPYTIRWNSSNSPTSCQETVSPAGSIDFPQSLLNGSQTMDPALLEPGTYTYKIHCVNAYGTADDFVNVDVSDVPLVSSLDLLIKLSSESTYHTYPAGQSSGNGGAIDLNPITLVSGSTTLCGPGSPCEANQTVNLDWTGVNVSNCSATAKYKISTDALPTWNTPTPVAATGQLSMLVAHYGVTRFIVTCDKPSGGQISDTVYANLETKITAPSFTGATATGDFYVPENVGSLGVSMGSFGGRGGTTSADGVDGDGAYFNKDNGTANGQDYLVVYGGKGGKQSVALGGTANGGLGASVYYPPGNVVSYGSLGIYLLGYVSGEPGHPTTTSAGGAGGMYQNGIATIVTGSMSLGSSGVSVQDGGAGAAGTAGLTGGGGGGSGGYITARFSAASPEKFKFKGASKLPAAGPGTVFLYISTMGDTNFSSPY